MSVDACPNLNLSMTWIYKRTWKDNTELQMQDEQGEHN